MLFYCFEGLKFGVDEDTADSEEASALGHLSDRIMIYSNSWGPADYGFIVDGPEYLTKLTISIGVETVMYSFICTKKLMISPLYFSGS